MKSSISLITVCTMALSITAHAQKKEGVLFPPGFFGNAEPVLYVDGEQVDIESTQIDEIVRNSPSSLPLEAEPLDPANFMGRTSESNDEVVKNSPSSLPLEAEPLDPANFIGRNSESNEAEFIIDTIEGELGSQPSLPPEGEPLDPTDFASGSSEIPVVGIRIIREIPISRSDDNDQSEPGFIIDTIEGELGSQPSLPPEGSIDPSDVIAEEENQVSTREIAGIIAQTAHATLNPNRSTTTPNCESDSQCISYRYANNCLEVQFSTYNSSGAEEAISDLTMLLDSTTLFNQTCPSVESIGFCGVNSRCDFEVVSP